MKRVLTAVFFLVASSSYLAAQSPVNFGVKIGGNFADVSWDTDIEGVEFDDVKRQFGFVVGGFVRFNLGKISIQPELLYSQKRFKDETEIEGEYTVNDIDIPVLVGVDLVDQGPVRLRVVAGPIVSVKASAKIDYADGSIVVDENEAYESARFGFAAGLSLDITKLVFDLRFNGQFSNTFDPEAILGPGETDLSSKANWIQATVGFKFL